MSHQVNSWPIPFALHRKSEMLQQFYTEEITWKVSNRVGDYEALAITAKNIVAKPPSGFHRCTLRALKIRKKRILAWDN